MDARKAVGHPKCTLRLLKIREARFENLLAIALLGVLRRFAA